MIRSTATLACVGRRQAYFRDEFLATLEILHRGDVRPEQLKGSWAGAFGPTQFMPTSFKRFAVDFDGDGRRDVVDIDGRLIASTANNLKKDGWVDRPDLGLRGRSCPRASTTCSPTARKQKTHGGVGSARHQARRRQADSRVRDDKAYLLVPAGHQGPGFLMLHNFRVIMKYNPAEAYALAIGHLADRLRGGDAVRAAVAAARGGAVARRAARAAGTAADSKGFDAGEPTGRLGPKTRAAVRDFQASIGLVPDGFATAAILARLRGRLNASSLQPVTMPVRHQVDNFVALIDR